MVTGSLLLAIIKHDLYWSILLPYNSDMYYDIEIFALCSRKINPQICRQGMLVTAIQRHPFSPRLISERNPLKAYM